LVHEAILPVAHKPSTSGMFPDVAGNYSLARDGMFVDTGAVLLIRGHRTRITGGS
jgi:hypothetical protein